MPACSPWCGSIDGPVRPSFSSNNSRPSRGAKTRKANDTNTSLGAASLGWLPRSGDIYARGTSRGSCDASHDDCSQAGARWATACSVLVSSLVLKGQAQARSPEASGKGLHIGATRPRPAGRQDGGHRGAQDGVSTSAFGSQRPPLVRIACTSCPLSKWPLLAPFLLNIWEEHQGLYK